MNTQNTAHESAAQDPGAQGQGPAAQSEGRPLGYWLRTVDRLLAERFAQAFEREGLTRRDWRRINLIDGTAPGSRFGGGRGGRGACRDDADGWRRRRDGWHIQGDHPDRDRAHSGDLPGAEPGDRLGDRPDGWPDDRPGRADRHARRVKKLRRLAERGWIAEADEGWSLTDSGREAKERLAIEVRGIRAAVADAVEPEDYAVTVRSLERIAVALGWDPDAPIRPGRGRGRGRNHPRWGSAEGSRRPFAE